MYHTTNLSSSISSWPEHCSDLVSAIRHTIKDLIYFDEKRDAFEADIKVKKDKDPSYDPYGSGDIERIAEREINTSERNHEDVARSFVRLFKSSTELERLEIIALPDFLLIFDSYGRSRGVLTPAIKELLAFPPGYDLFLEAHKPILKVDGSVEALPLMAPADSILTWYSVFDGELAASLWTLAEEELARIKKFGPGGQVTSTRYVNATSGPLRVYDANMDVSNKYCRRRVVTALLRVKDLPQSISDTLSFEDPWSSSSSLDYLPPGQFSVKSLARYFAASNSSLMYQMVRERNIDPKVISTLLPSWEGDAESLLDSAKTLSA